VIFERRVSKFTEFQEGHSLLQMRIEQPTGLQDLTNNEFLGNTIRIPEALAVKGRSKTVVTAQCFLLSKRLQPC